MLRAVTAFLLLAMAAVAPLSDARAERRVALVIGNSDYRHTARLQNPRNDASDVAAALRRLGFTVVEGLDLDRDGMMRRVRDFAAALRGADVGLFFYAGHGLQVDGKNFLAPVDARLASETDLDFEAVQLNLVLRQLERNARLSLVFLDACRDNPMATTLARSLKARSRSVSIGRGLARVEKAVGMMIAFATQPGNVALDGKGRNSPFTKALLQNIESPGATIGDVMIEVRKDVVADTDGRQVPWENSSLTGKFYFKPGSGTRQEVGGAPSDLLDVPNTTFDHTFWTSIRDSNNAALFQDYLKRFPDGVFTPIARSKLDSLRSVGRKNAETRPETPGKPAGKAVEHASLQASDGLTAPASDGGAAAPVPETSGPQLARDTQTALKQLGCYTGQIDGKWGSGSRAAMRRLNRVANLDLPAEPSVASLDILKSMYFYKGRRCPILTKKRIEPRTSPKATKRNPPTQRVKRTGPAKTKQVKKRVRPAETKNVKKRTGTSSKKRVTTRTSPKTQPKRSTQRRTAKRPQTRTQRRSNARAKQDDLYTKMINSNLRGY